MRKLVIQAGAFIIDFYALGFGEPDTPVNGGDCVDVICHYEGLLRKLPALVAVADSAEACRVAGGRDEFTMRYNQLLAALETLKGA